MFDQSVAVAVTGSLLIMLMFDSDERDKAKALTMVCADCETHADLLHTPVNNVLVCAVVAIADGVADSLFYISILYTVCRIEYLSFTIISLAEIEMSRLDLVPQMWQ